METFRDEGVHGEEDPFRSYFVGVEDACGMVGLVVPMKSSSEASLSLRLTNQFPSSSVDHGCKRSIIISVLEDARVLSALVGVANYLRRFVTEEDQDKMYVVESTCLFNEAQQALNRVTPDLFVDVNFCTCIFPSLYNSFFCVCRFRCFITKPFFDFERSWAGMWPRSGGLLRKMMPSNSLVSKEKGRLKASVLS